MISIVMNGQQEQVTTERARELFLAGALKPDDLAFLDGGSKWESVRSVAQIVDEAEVAIYQPNANLNKIIESVDQKSNILPSTQPLLAPIQTQLVNPAVFQLSQANPAARAQYEANKLSLGTAFIFLIFLGYLGAHRFYMGRTATAITLLCCTLLSLLLMFVLIGFFTIWISAIWIFVDIFLISEIVRQHNASLAAKLFHDQNFLIL